MARTKKNVQRTQGQASKSSLGANMKRGGIQKEAPSKAAAAVKKAATTSKKGKQVASTGVFGQYVLNIAEKLRDDGPDEYSLSVFPDADNSKLVWAKFELDCMEGCMKFGKCHVSNGQTTYDFKWRGRETGEGEIECGSENKGSLKFSGKRVEGKVQTPFGKLEVTGEKVSQTPEDTDWSTWEDCTEDQHEVERVNRWKR